MCGIVGYIGAKKVVPLILDGLRRLEYRGYDSAGIAVVGDRRQARNSPRPGQAAQSGRSRSAVTPIDGAYGIGHTRWATHGRPTEENAHPHRDCNGEIVVVHNGIVENYVELKQQLLRRRPQVRHRNRHRNHRPPGREILEGRRPLEDAVRKTVKRHDRRLRARRSLDARIPTRSSPRARARRS